MLKKPRPRGIYVAVKIILLEILPARDIYLQQEIYISSKRYTSPARARHISPARQTYISRQRQTFKKYKKIGFCRHNFCSKFGVAHIVQPQIFIKCICLFPTRDRYLNYFLTICILKPLKARGIYLAAKIVQLDISPARDIYFQLEIYISSQRYRYIFRARDIYLQLEIDIQTFRLYISKNTPTGASTNHKNFDLNKNLNLTLIQT